MISSEYPDILKAALENDTYSKDGSDYTTTEILKPPQMTWLAQHHEPQSQPLYKGFMALMGTGVHSVLEERGQKEHIVEKRFYHTFEIGGREILLGGKPDFIAGPYLADYKVILTTGAPESAPKPEHYWQAQFNSWLANQSGHEIRVGVVEYIFRDWTFSRAKYNKAYPKEPRKPFAVDILPADEIEAKLIERLTLHEEARKGNPAPCSDEDRWKKDDTWALMKPNAKKARKLCSSEAEAKDLVKTGEIIEHRPGEAIRCSSWCEFSDSCPQFQKDAEAPS